MADGWRLPQGWEMPSEDDDTKDVSTEQENSVEETSSEETTPQVSVSEESVPTHEGNLLVTEELPEPTVEEEERSDEQVPFAVLNVYGQEIPINSKKELVNLAQQGVDYNSKMYALRQWKQHIEAISKNNLLKEVVERAVKGEDINAVLLKAMSGKTETEEPTDSTHDDLDDSGDFKQYISKQVTEAVQPHLQEVERLKKLLFFEKMRSSDPQYFDLVYGVMREAYAAPGAIPDAMKKAIDSDPATFVEFYKSTRQAVLSRMGVQDAPAPAAQPPVKPLTETPEPAKPEEASVNKNTKVTLKRSVQRPPVLEGGRESQMETQAQVLNEAEAIWDMPLSKFEELMRRNQNRYVH